MILLKLLPIGTLEGDVIQIVNEMPFFLDLFYTGNFRDRLEDSQIVLLLNLCGGLEQIIQNRTTDENFDSMFFKLIARLPWDDEDGMNQLIQETQNKYNFEQQWSLKAQFTGLKNSLNRIIDHKIINNDTELKENLEQERLETSELTETQFNIITAFNRFNPYLPKIESAKPELTSGITFLNKA
jgi:hypothetical protein